MNSFVFCLKKEQQHDTYVKRTLILSKKGTNKSKVFRHRRAVGFNVQWKLHKQNYEMKRKRQNITNDLRYKDCPLWVVSCETRFAAMWMLVWLLRLRTNGHHINIQSRYYYIVLHWNSLVENKIFKKRKQK